MYSEGRRTAARGFAMLPEEDRIDVMTDYDHYRNDHGPDLGDSSGPRMPDEYIPAWPPPPRRPVLAEAVAEPPSRPQPPTHPRRRRLALPAVLFVLTCLTTFAVGGWLYAVPLMTILVFHEMGHFIQTLRYRVPASLPFFIPMPLAYLGTMGAVIGMEAHKGDRRALFDIGITGPLAGLVPTIIFCVVGLQLSEVKALPEGPGQGIFLGEPLLFQWMSHHIFGQLPEGKDIVLHPMAYAGWVGLLITALNLIPIGQLDGGHILYALLRQRAHQVATALLFAAVAAVVIFGYWAWMLMLLLLIIIGPAHPPTANDNAPLGAVRVALGIFALALVPIGFTPMPFKFMM